MPGSENPTALKPASNQDARPVRLPELLAPAGDWDCVRAAIENGADAIYFGLDRFNARMRAKNFTETDLPELVQFLHRRGVKGYVTLNTLVFQNELAEAERYLTTMIAAGIDAVIVQDVGICRLIRRLSPDFPIHASTQMTVTSAEGIAFAKQLGCNLVVLARECTLKEIDRIQTPALPIEVFVHGALCVAYSGQCLTSEALGGRSANRGECAQACRMPYELLADGQKVPLGDRRYLLSPQDLAGLQVLPELVHLGVASLKIEGRLKSPEYVANITRVYRQALETLRHSADLASPTPNAASRSREFGALVDASRYSLEMAFSRGLYTGWFGGINNQELVHARFGKKRGVHLGEISQVARDRVRIELKAPLKPGDGVVFDAGRPEENEQGGRIYELDHRGRDTWLAFGHGDVDFRRVHVGDKLWKTSDPELDRRLRQSYATDKPAFKRPVELEVHGAVGEPMQILVRDELGHVLKVESSLNLAAAQSQPLTTERLKEHLGRLGRTPFILGELRNELVGETILPLSELNRLRRQWVDQLEALRSSPKRWTLNVAQQPEALTRNPAPALEPELTVLVRSLPQLEAALACDVRTVYCEFEDPKAYRKAVHKFRQWQAGSSFARDCAQSGASTSCYVAPPRIFKMGEDWILRQVRSCEADGYLVRNYDQLKFFSDSRRIGDYSLNVANALTAEYFKNTFGLERLTASYDLNDGQLEALLQAAPAGWFEVTLHQHMPMFHMDHCLFCAFLSSGTDYTNCGRPCDHHALQLQDRVGAKHAVKADAGCRNTVFNALAQTGAEHASKLLLLGVCFFRLEFVDESPDLVTRTIRQYRRLLEGKITGTQLWRELKLLNQLGVTRGQAQKDQ